MPPLDPALLQRAIYALGVPAALAGVGVLVTFLIARRTAGGRRAAAWVAPLAAALGIGLAWEQPLHDATEPGSLSNDWARWMHLLPALLSVLVLWPIALMFRPATRGRRWMGAAYAAIPLAAAAGAFAGLARYDGQASAWLYLTPAATALLALLLFPVAADDPRPGDAWAATLAGAVALPMVALTEFWTPAMLTACAVAASAVASLAASFAGERHGEWRRGLVGGALAVPLLLPAAATVAGFNSYVLTPALGVALALPAIGAVLGIWAARLPRAGAVVVAGVVALAGLAVVLTQVDLRPYFPSLSAGEAEVQTPASSSGGEYDYWGGN